MFEKQKISFKSKDVFDSKFTPNVDICFCTVSKLLFNNIINIDGSIDMEKAITLKKHELWSYIYYLYSFNNKTINEFIAMRTPRNNKANAELFYNSVLEIIGKSTNSTSSIDINDLIYFINVIIHKYEDNLVNPVIGYLKKILSREIIPVLGNLSVKTGNSSNVTILTNPDNVKSSNVQVKYTVNSIK
jgi:hypothetical protein